jgi:hypothetical protein
MDDPDVIVCVDGDADGLPENPVIGKRLGPSEIDFEARRSDRGGVRGGEEGGTSEQVEMHGD